MDKVKDLLTYENLEKAKEVLDPYYVTYTEAGVYVVIAFVLGAAIGYFFGGGYDRKR